MELKARDEERADARRREEEAQRAFDEELRRMIDKGKQARMPRITAL